MISYMKRDSRLSTVLHALLHMAEQDGPVTSAALAQCLGTNPVVVRRTMAHLRQAGLVVSDRGHAGGWRIAADPSAVTMRQLYDALGAPAVFAMGHRHVTPDCLVERAINAVLGTAFAETEAVLLERFSAITLTDLLQCLPNQEAEPPQPQPAVPSRPSAPFSDPVAVSTYAERTARIVPGLQDLHRMAAVLLAERAPAAARVLVLGAGGGLELKAFAGLQPAWRFDGVDPSAEMLQLARDTLGPLAARVRFHEGFIDDAPMGPFDAAVCLLTLHFLPAAERRQTLAALQRRLKPGAPLVLAHHSFPDDGSAHDTWLARSAAYAAATGVPAAQAKNSIAAMRARLPVLSPQQDVALLREAGFVQVELFYCAFTFRGWVAYTP